MAFMMAILKQQRRKKDRGHINQAAISPWLSNNQADSSIRQKQRKQKVLSQFAASGFGCSRTGHRVGPSQGCWEHWREPGSSRQNSTAAQTNRSLQEKQINSTLKFHSHMQQFPSQLLAFLSSLFIFWGKREREKKLIYFRSVERKQAWMWDTRLSRTSTNFCWRSSPPRWPSELCWGAWKGCSAYLPPAEPRCTGHRTAWCGTEPTSMFYN